MPNGFVTTGPLAGAPALGFAALLVLAIMLAMFAFYAIRRRRLPSTIALAAAMVLLSSVGLMARPSLVVIDGDDCLRTVTNDFDLGVETILRNDCDNPIQILRLEAQCTMQAGDEEHCYVGTTLASGKECILPSCES